MKKKIIRIIAIILIPTACLYFLQLLFMPKYVSDINEGSMIEEYYKSSKNHDVLILGDCEVYENISPVTMWEEYGITSYIRGSSEQLIWQSYYLLEDTLKYETPKVVVLNVLAMQQSEAKSEAYNRMTLDGMRWSFSKLNSIKESMTEEESIISYVFPFLRYHSRWSELTSDDIKYMFDKPNVTTNGYLMQVGVRPMTVSPQEVPLKNYQFSERNYRYLDKIRQLCEEKGIKLVLMKAPTIYPVWYEQWEKQIEEYADKNDLLYYNFLETMDKAGIDLTTDTYDAGLHLNVEGAEKLSKYFGKILVQECGLSDNRKDEALSEVWREKACAYEAEKEKKYRESGQSGNNSERITDK